MQTWGIPYKSILKFESNHLNVHRFISSQNAIQASPSNKCSVIRSKNRVFRLDMKKGLQFSTMRKQSNSNKRALLKANTAK